MVKNAFSDGYSVGSGCVGFDEDSAPNAELLNASTPDGPATRRSLIDPSLCTLNCITTCPFIDIAAYGMIQLRFTCAMKRRIHGPNSTPFVSNWISGPNCPPLPPGLSNV